MKIDRNALFKLFAEIDDNCSGEQVLCVIGAASILAHGHNGRQTQDVDVWRPASTINDRALQRAVEAAGIGYNPVTVHVDGIYLRVITPGVVNLPAYIDGKWSNGQPSETLWQGDKLRIVAPPPSVIVAAKLVRGEDRDVDDCAYLIEAKRIDLADIRLAIVGIPDDHDRHTAEENLVLLSALDPSADNLERSNLAQNTGEEPSR